MNILLKYLRWQFIDSPKKVLMIIGNYLLFGTDLFSIKESLGSLFSPWRRQTCSYGRGLDIGKIAEAFSSNLIARIIGFIMRLFLIAAFIIYEAACLLVGSIVFLFVLTYPVLAVWGIIYSFKYF